MRCSQLMETRVHVCRETDGVAVVARIMRDESIGFVPVCDAHGRPIRVETAERSARIFRAIASRDAMIIMR